MKRIILFVILTTIIGCSGEKKQNTTTQKENIKIVKSIELEEKTIANIKNYNGEVKPQQEMKIITTTGGNIEEIYLKNGDRVKKGEVIAKISNADVEASFFEVQGQLLKANSTYSTGRLVAL